MKLEKCTPYVVEMPAQYGGHGGQYWTFLKLETDEGVVGWGECAALNAFQKAWRPFCALVDGLFEAYVKGQDALAREKIAKIIYNRVSNSHPDFVISCLISAFDTALWDIAGKVFGQPIYQLLGGKYRDTIRSYSYIYAQPGVSTIDAWLDADLLVKSAMPIVEKGYTALKYDPIPMASDSGYPATPFEMSPEMFATARKTVSALRKAIGDKVDILIGTHGQLTTASAIKLGKMLEDYDVCWYEEPVSPENAREMGRVARAVHVPISTGERLVTVYDFQRIFEEDACAIAQPDLGIMGGISEAKKVAGMAEAKYIQLAPHCWGGPIILAAAIQLDTAIPNFLIQETIDEGEGFLGELINESFGWKDGYIPPLEGPGLGVTLNEQALEKYAAK